MALTKIQTEVLEGLMLGDGNLSIGGRSINPRLRINRAGVDDTYSEWIAEIFRPYTTAKSLKRSTVFDRRTNRTYDRTSFNTRRRPDFLPGYERWYGEGRKHLPKKLKLTPQTVAVWFADDGSFSLRKYGGVELKFNTSGFLQCEVDRLVALLNDRYEEGFSKYGGYSGTNHYVIMASTRPARRLLRDIDPVFPALDRKSSIWREGFSLVSMPRCPQCGADAVFKDGFYSYKVRKQRLRCRICKFCWLLP
jgi:hypothetical protein